MLGCYNTEVSNIIKIVDGSREASDEVKAKAEGECFHLKISDLVLWLNLEKAE